jgi:hypothetical protein
VLLKTALTHNIILRSEFTRMIERARAVIDRAYSF